MENSSNSYEQESIGALFRRIRLERSLDIADVAAETRITPDTIRAMEADDYKSLPALAFARGFYNLYATMLGLNADEIVERFSAEYKQVEAGDYGFSTPSWQADNIGSMAERPSHVAGATIGLGLLIAIVLAVVISWFAGYNPATELSKWLRGFQEPSVEIIKQPETSPDEAQTALPEPQAGADQVNEVTVEQEETPAVAPSLSEAINYQLVAEFMERTEVSISIDDGSPEQFTIAEGTIRTWQADRSINLQLPAGASVRLYLNGISVPLPAEADNGQLNIAIPEYLLE